MFKFLVFGILLWHNVGENSALPAEFLNAAETGFEDSYSEIIHEEMPPESSEYLEAVDSFGFADILEGLNTNGPDDYDGKVMDQTNLDGQNADFDDYTSNRDDEISNHNDLDDHQENFEQKDFDDQQEISENNDSDRLPKPSDLTDSDVNLQNSVQLNDNIPNFYEPTPDGTVTYTAWTIKSDDTPADANREPRSNRWFTLFGLAMSWNDARKTCHEHGGNLVVIRSEAEENNLIRLLKGAGIDGAWIGVHNMFNDKEWVSVFDEPIEKTGWFKWSPLFELYSTVPNEKECHCAQVLVGGGMTDQYCHIPRPFICSET